MGNCPITSFAHSQVYGSRCDSSKGTEGSDRTALQDTFNHLPAVLANSGGPTRTEVTECDSSLEEGQGGGSGELQVCQSELSTRDGYGADHLECHHIKHIQDN